MAEFWPFLGQKYIACGEIHSVYAGKFYRVATDTGITGKYLNILEKYFILELYLKNFTFFKKSWKIKNILELYWNFEILILENTGIF